MTTKQKVELKDRPRERKSEADETWCEAVWRHRLANVKVTHSLATPPGTWRTVSPRSCTFSALSIQVPIAVSAARLISCIALSIRGICLWSSRPVSACSFSIPFEPDGVSTASTLALHVWTILEMKLPEMYVANPPAVPSRSVVPPFIFPPPTFGTQTNNGGSRSRHTLAQRIAEHTQIFLNIFFIPTNFSLT